MTLEHNPSACISLNYYQTFIVTMYTVTLQCLTTLYPVLSIVAMALYLEMVLFLAHKGIVHNGVVKSFICLHLKTQLRTINYRGSIIVKDF